MITIGASHGWVATLKDDGILRLQDDLNPFASYKDPKCIPLPPLETLPDFQTSIITNVAMSTSSPEDDDCVVAVKFLGTQLSFFRPAWSGNGWTSISTSPCFYSSRVMFSKRDDMFCIPGFGGLLIESYRPYNYKRHNYPKFKKLRYRKLPKFDNSTRDILESCSSSEHLVESRPTGETFLVKWYKKMGRATRFGTVVMKTYYLMVFKLDGRGNAVYTKDIGDLCIFLSNSEPFCVLLASSFPDVRPNEIVTYDKDEVGFFSLKDSALVRREHYTIMAPYHIPPQNI